jgi:hypothetical protein
MVEDVRGLRVEAERHPVSAKKPEGYADLHALSEDERIGVIGHTVTAHGKTVAVCVDDQPAKVERYKRKLRERFPSVVILDTTKGPVKGVVTIRVGPQ